MCRVLEMTHKAGIGAWVLSALLLLAGCSSSKKAYNKARELEAAGLYVEAVQYDLRALRDNPDFKEARLHLKKVAPRAYEELLERCRRLEAARDWDQAAAEYERLDGLLRGMHRYGVVLETIDVEERLQWVRRQAAQKHFARAERLFQQGHWQKAGNAYLKAHAYVDNYNGALEKALAAYLRLGDERLRAREFKPAIKAYERILEIAPNHPDVRKRLAEAHYRFGRYLFREKRFREALGEFETVRDYVADYKDTPKWIERAYEEAVQFVAVFPFGNRSRQPVDGTRLALDVLTRLSGANLRFVDFLSYPETVSVLRDHRLLRAGLLTESQLLQVARAEDLDAFVWGVIRELRVEEEPASFVEYEHMRTVVVDSAGHQVERTEPIYFREYRRSRRVHLGLEYWVVEASTSRHLDRGRFARSVDDEARWVAYQGSIYDLPEEKRPLLDAPRDPRATAVLLDELLDRASEAIARDVIRFYR